MKAELLIPNDNVMKFWQSAHYQRTLPDLSDTVEVIETNLIMKQLNN